MNPKLVLGVIDLVEPEFDQGGILLAHYLPTSDIFPDEWFLPGLTIEDGQGSPLESFNRHMVETFDKDFCLKDWVLKEEIRLREVNYDLVVLKGTLTNGIFKLPLEGKYYDAAWFGSMYKNYVDNKELIKKILSFEAS